MKCFWRSPEVTLHSVEWQRSLRYPGVQFAVRTASFAQRLDLVRRTQEAIAQNDYLRAGLPLEKLQAEKADLLAKQIFLQWGLSGIKGLRLDGRRASVENLLEYGPMDLCDEIVESIRAQLELSEDERKNS